MKTIRKAVCRQQLEAQLSKYERRIQKLAEQAYRVRQVLEAMIAEERKQDAVFNADTEEHLRESADEDARRLDLQDPAASEVVLGEQPATVLDDSGDIGVDSGGAV
jgi:septal ring factor EnvC (AmiA/AmiB activator)